MANRPQTPPPARPKDFSLSMDGFDFLQPGLSPFRWLRSFQLTLLSECSCCCLSFCFYDLRDESSWTQSSWPGAYLEPSPLWASVYSAPEGILCAKKGEGSVVCPAIIGGASSCSRWEQVQRPTARYHAGSERETLAHSALNGMSPPNPSSQAQGTLQQRWWSDDLSSEQICVCVCVCIRN